MGIRSDVPVLFLETGFHFAETLAFKEQLTERLGLNVIDLVGQYTVEAQALEFGERLYESDPSIRLAQYVLLGLGGVRALRALGIEPGVPPEPEPL